MREAEFLSQLVEKTECKLLCDVSNAVVSARNMGYDEQEYIDSLPANAIAEFHLGGYTPQEDEDIAMAGVIRFEAANKPSASSVTYLPAKQVSQAFVKGMPLVRGSNYKVDASHRDEAGMVEIHTRDTDIIYMLEGTTTLVTGGTTIDAKTIEPEEIRGKESRGGESRVVTKGDVVIIPNGTPHWFKEVKGSINYYVVKVRSAN